MKCKKQLCIVMCALFILASLFGCAPTENQTPSNSGTTSAGDTTNSGSSGNEQNSNDANTPDTSKEVTLKLFCVGDASPGNGSQMVADAVSEYIKPLINATIETEYIPWADWTNKYSLLFASGEEFDGIYTANWSYYQPTATKNGFLELTPEMLETYAPDVMKELPEMAWNQAKINGKIYMVPTTFNEFVSVHYTVREDLRLKYNIPEIKDINGFESYLKAISENEPTMVPMDISSANDYIHLQALFNQQYEYDVVGGVALRNFVYQFTDPGVKILNTFETPEFAAFVEKMYSWREAGYWSQNAMSNQTTMDVSFKNGKSASCLSNMLAATNYAYEWRETQPDWSVEVYDATSENHVVATPYIGSGIGIHSTSKNPERLLMFINLARTDEYLNRLLCYGIKDVHYKLVDNDKVDYIRGNADTDYTDGLSWFFRNTEYQLQPVDSYAGYDALYNSLDSRQVGHVLQAFTFDDSNLKNEIAALTNVVSQYAIPLITGAVEPKEGIATLNAKAKEAGIDKVLEEVNQQANAYIAENMG